MNVCWFKHDGLNWKYKLEVDGNEFKTIVQFNSGGGSFEVRVFGR
jgi:hypothetical protein